MMSLSGCGTARFSESPFATPEQFAITGPTSCIKHAGLNVIFAGNGLDHCFGKKLGCCADFSDCHGHVVAEWADKLHAKWEELKPDKVVMRAGSTKPSLVNANSSLDVKLNARRPKQAESGDGNVEVGTVTSSDDDYCKALEPFVEIPLTPRTVASYFDEFELNGYAWKDQAHSPKKSGRNCCGRKFRAQTFKKSSGLDDEELQLFRDCAGTRASYGPFGGYEGFEPVPRPSSVGVG